MHLEGRERIETPRSSRRSMWLALDHPRRKWIRQGDLRALKCRCTAQSGDRGWDPCGGLLLYTPPEAGIPRIISRGRGTPGRAFS